MKSNKYILALILCLAGFAAVLRAVTQQKEKPAPRREMQRQRIMMQDTAIGPNTLTYVQVFDAAGILVNEQIIKGQIVSVDIPFKQGIYLIKAGQRIRKIVVE